MDVEKLRSECLPTMKNKTMADRRLDKDLGFIRNNGRMAFTETNPSGFSRIVHDYTDAKKGFIVWKDQLEERLT